MSEDPTSPTRTPTLFAEDSLVSHSVTPASSRLKTTPDISGQRCLGLSGNAGPLGLLEKTLLESSAWAWTKYSLTWRAKATPQGRLIFQLAPLMPRTDATEFGLLHTPTAKANQMAPSMNSGWREPTMWATPTAANAVGTSRPPSKGGGSRDLRQDVRMWPTPTARDYKDNGNSPAELARNSVTLATHAGGSLNPEFVEYLMGYPVGYTDLNN